MISLSFTNLSPELLSDLKTSPENIQTTQAFRFIFLLEILLCKPRYFLFPCWSVPLYSWSSAIAQNLHQHPGNHFCFSFVLELPFLESEFFSSEFFLCFHVHIFPEFPKKRKCWDFSCLKIPFFYPPILVIDWLGRECWIANHFPYNREDWRYPSSCSFVCLTLETFKNFYLRCCEISK